MSEKETINVRHSARNIKKALVLLAAFLLFASLTACGSQNSEAAAENQPVIEKISIR